MTSLVSMTSCSRRHSLQSRRIRKLGTGSTIRMDPLSSRYRRILFLKYQPIRLRTLGGGEEAFGATALRPEFGIFNDRPQHSTPALQRAAHNRLVCIGGVKLADLDRVSFDAIMHANHHVD